MDEKCCGFSMFMSFIWPQWCHPSVPPLMCVCAKRLSSSHEMGWTAETNKNTWAERREHGSPTTQAGHPHTPTVLFFSLLWFGSSFPTRSYKVRGGEAKKGRGQGAAPLEGRGGGFNNKQQMKGAVESRKTGLSDPDSDPLKFQGRQLDWLAVPQNLIKFEMTQWTYFHTDILSVGQTTDETVAV